MTRQPKIGQRLAAARLRRQQSQAAVARGSGIAASYLSRIETGKVQPTYRTLARIARAIGVPFDELAEFDPAAHPQGTHCPISHDGSCMLDLIHSDSLALRRSGEEFYTVRQLRLLRQVAEWVRTATPKRLQALEVLFEDLDRRGHS